MTELSDDKRRTLHHRSFMFVRRHADSVKRSFKEDPVAFSRKVVYFIWVSVVLLAVLSLLGFNVNPFSASTTSVAISVDESAVEEVVEEEEKIEQVLVKSTKSGRRYEISFACQEVECIETCARHTTKKCKKSEHCLNSRAKDCKKKCRKKRCENRCNDAAMSYVEREMKLEQCKDACGSSKPEKCKAKCDVTFLPCKTKCRNDIKKYVCDRQPDLPQPITEDIGVAAAHITHEEDLLTADDV